MGVILNNLIPIIGSSIAMSIQDHSRSLIAKRMGLSNPVPSLTS